MGRPTAYKPEYCDQVVEWGKQGYSRTEIANALDVVRSTLANWEAVHPEFLVAMERSKQASQSWWEQQGRMGVWNERDGRTINAALYSRSMAARFPEDWRENNKTTISGDPDSPLRTENAYTFQLPPAVEGMLSSLLGAGTDDADPATSQE